MGKSVSTYVIQTKIAALRTTCDLNWGEESLLNTRFQRIRQNWSQ